MSAPFTEAQPHRLHFDPKLLLHRPGWLVIVKYPKDHPRVTDTSNGARGVCAPPGYFPPHEEKRKQTHVMMLSP